ncbi:Wee kinase [Toxoplasma gondii GAB2-2007-GAL-DOM2]|uniref:non-specific serine/threonine protein kinase n=6 Tax=Toxoplasma gondii TaxID=5811 RepID=S7V3G0_TOXGG|nr:Wee kinase [Toxoplasma gondii GT1]KAF4642022.1 Wee kinase [Toxoplasma gondii]KFG49094.1 Wee kinase [Toxoplasma gondii GAB2-2007-GAL-DOM2]KFG50065.1 Wee kinase [Toxoplasma gondii FOU]PUA92416.1 Wee kinase [Toxoplasma gondii TgCATBr9]RQX75577.1 Wee kinase [Toxoplasma gondii CAST]
MDSYSQRARNPVDEQCASFLPAAVPETCEGARLSEPMSSFEVLPESETRQCQLGTIAGGGGAERGPGCDLSLHFHADSPPHQPILLALPGECGLLSLPPCDDAILSLSDDSRGGIRCPSGGLRLSTPVSTDTALTNNYEIVLYKNRNIVLYNPHTNRAGARPITAAEERALSLNPMGRCPLCGQTADLKQFSFEARTYFQILQHLFRRLRRQQSSASSPSRYSRFTTETSEVPASSLASVVLETSDVSSPPTTALLSYNTSSEATESSDRYTAESRSSPSAVNSVLRTRGASGNSSPGGTRDDDSTRSRHAAMAQSAYSAADSSSSFSTEFEGQRECREHRKTDPPEREEPQSPFFSFGAYQPQGVDAIPSTRNIPAELLITGYYNRFFIEKQKLGSGSYGQVYLCTHILDELTLGEYAVKKLPVGDDKHWLAKMLQEVKIREKLHHPNIVDYKHSWLEMHRSNPMCPWVPWLFVLMEYCNGDSLENLIWDRGVENPPSRYLTDDQIWKLFFDILFGLQHLHHSAILYRDMKPPNVLLQHSVERMTGKLQCRAQLSDFGTAELLGERIFRAERNGYTGTIEFTAPELLETDERGLFSPNYDMKSDMWSLGMILYAMCYARVPYTDKEPSRCRRLILGHTCLSFPKRPPRDPTFKLLIGALTAKDSAQRPSTDDIIDDVRVRRILNDRERLDRAAEEIVNLLQKKSAPTDSLARSQQTSRTNMRRSGTNLSGVCSGLNRENEAHSECAIVSHSGSPLVPLPALGPATEDGAEGQDQQLACRVGASTTAFALDSLR